MIQIIDKLAALVVLIILSPLFLILILIISIETGSPFFIQSRMGKNKKKFKLIKFRTMKINTKSTATHLVSKDSITKSGIFLRKIKLDELPQLINILKGHMSFVGPRPNLSSQKEVIISREKLNIYDALPGITGLAQLIKQICQLLHF